ncbi:hypothetical protein Glove_318g34 [Diversispora epigaea]|uniref:BTB domain-containing protein n=1 Tax=Diversispora epigaea TaxID=1348612 RepID=A0A397HQI9_9GLOM|nr:hypothetical protein Glove_318g34 [Diversispora epigaea]
MTLKFFDKLSQNFIELLNDKNDYNVIIEVENKEKSFTAHSNVLKYRSTYFRTELENIQPNENNIKTIDKSNVSAQIFDVILKYIYGGIVNLENIEARFIFDLMLAANEFDLEEFTNKLETFLINSKSIWLRNNFFLIYHSIFDKNDFKKLEKFCNYFVARNPNLIFDADNFTSLPESALISLLRQDNLQMKEIKIWDKVIEWGVSQNPTLPTNLEEWNKDNFTTLKTTLQQCLPLIHYFHISNIKIMDKIKPYRRILDKQLWEDIIQYMAVPNQPIKSIILPPRSNQIFSTIISEDHVAEISTWIDRKSTTYSTADIPYKFELILRGIGDGFAPQIFWDICSGHAHTVIVTKVKGTDEILGGYNPLKWNNSNMDNQWMETKDSFIFSLKNGNVQNSILSRVKNHKNAIFNRCKNDQDKYGPQFGSDFYMYSSESDFTLSNSNYCYRHSYYYKKPIRTTLSDVENKEKSFTAHSNVLKYQSSYFRMELKNIQPNENNNKIITNSSISTQIFDVVLKFIFDLMLATNEFELEELANKLESHLKLLG